MYDCNLGCENHSVYPPFTFRDTTPKVRITNANHKSFGGDIHNLLSIMDLLFELTNLKAIRLSKECPVLLLSMDSLIILPTILPRDSAIIALTLLNVN